MWRLLCSHTVLSTTAAVSVACVLVVTRGCVPMMRPSKSLSAHAICSKRDARQTPLVFTLTSIVSKCVMLVVKKERKKG